MAGLVYGITISGSTNPARAREILEGTLAMALLSASSGIVAGVTPRDEWE